MLLNLSRCWAARGFGTGDPRPSGDGSGRGGAVSKCLQQTQISPGPNPGGWRGFKRNTPLLQWLKHHKRLCLEAVGLAASAWLPLILVVQLLGGK